MEDGPEIVFDESVSEHVLEVFDWYVDEDGLIVDRTRQPAPTQHGEALSVDDLGGIVPDSRGRPMLIEDSVSAIAEYVERTNE